MMANKFRNSILTGSAICGLMGVVLLTACKNSDKSLHDQAASATQSVKSGIQTAADKTSDAADSLKQKASDASDSVSDSTQKAASKVKDKASQVADGVKDGLKSPNN